MSRPKIEIRTTATDWFLEAMGLFGVLLTVAYVILNYNDLPDTLAVHYNLTGLPDGYGTKGILFVLPATAILLHIAMTIGLRYPHVFNYPFAITGENAERQYKNMVLMVRILRTLIVAICFYLTFATIQNGLGKMNGLGRWFAPGTIGVLLGTIGFYLYKGFRLR